MSFVERLNFEERKPKTYEEVCELWKERSIKNEPFSGQFLIRLVSELNQIEGIDVSYHRTSELFTNETIQNYSGDVRALYSVLNNKNLAAFLNSKIEESAPLDQPLIKEAHRIIMFGSMDNHRYHERGERAGEYKRHHYCVGKYDVGADPEQVEELMGELCDICSKSWKDPLKCATVFHCYFEHIHPFADGNGRIGRWLTNYLLVLNGHPPVVFPSCDRSEYFNALESFDATEDFNTMYSWLKRQVTQSYSSWKEKV